MRPANFEGAMLRPVLEIGGSDSIVITDRLSRTALIRLNQTDCTVRRLSGITSIFRGRALLAEMPSDVFDGLLTAANVELRGCRFFDAEVLE